MRMPLAVLLSLWMVITPGIIPLAHAGIDGISNVIEGFVSKQFPDAESHFWVVNGIHWQEENELVIDVNAVGLKAVGQIPTENRYLILIVSGELAGAQHIPLDDTAICRPEQS